MMNGCFGIYGGMFVPPVLETELNKIYEEFKKAMADQGFIQELDYYLRQYVGRENPLYFAKNLTEELGGAKVYLKREDLNHTGAHKINNAIGQVLLAKRLGKKKIVAETGAGQHGVATATVCALMGIDCTIFMGAIDGLRQELNVFRMKMLGAKVELVQEGAKTLKDAVDAAFNYYIDNVDDTFYLLGSAVGPHPYPTMVKEFQSVIGKEARHQILAQEGRLPDYLVACVGGGSNAIGLFAPFFEDKDTAIIGVEPAGMGLESGKHAATITKGEEGIIHGFKCLLLKEADGIKETHSVAPGLDYPGVGPEHCYYNDIKRATYTSVTDQEAIDAFLRLSKSEGIIPAIESSHALAHTFKLAKSLSKDKIIITNLSGRGDKDVASVKGYLDQGIYLGSC